MLPCFNCCTTVSFSLKCDQSSRLSLAAQMMPRGGIWRWTSALHTCSWWEMFCSGPLHMFSVTYLFEKQLHATFPINPHSSYFTKKVLKTNEYSTPEHLQT
ncbi:hypothetical protein FQA47_022797 [Oryzias melastigma]|uniref:Uncharacterized protein n=1 Tax=Oryzias melastigma TaxID=30732 RepID=A0A834F942_ORYME|nr:hypothetical protein FQA47_022797 [Oryzias melastigma]